MTNKTETERDLPSPSVKSQNVPKDSYRIRDPYKTILTDDVKRGMLAGTVKQENTPPNKYSSKKKI